MNPSTQQYAELINAEMIRLTNGIDGTKDLYSTYARSEGDFVKITGYCNEDNLYIDPEKTLQNLQGVSNLVDRVNQLGLGSQWLNSMSHLWVNQVPDYIIAMSAAYGHAVEERI